MEFTVNEMHCGHCVGVITKTLQQLDPHARVEAELSTKKVVVESTQSREAIVHALSAAGYPAS